MPISESEELTREKLEELRRKNVCAECGGWLNMFLGEGGGAFVACNDWLRTHHEGVKKEARIFEPNIPTRRAEMEQEHGAAKTRALAKYIGAGPITRAIATEIVESLWGDAPAIEKTKAILLCHTYQLNPLMKHIYLVGYKRKDGQGNYIKDGQGNYVLDWSMMIGIGATRLQAQRKHHYSYMDLTPRKATQEEIDKILGDTADPGSVYGFCHVKDLDTGAEAFGIRGCALKERIKNEEKGNTHLNQACVRAERLALDRQYPGEMPSDVEAVDERYIEGEYQVLDRETGEITEAKPETEVPPEPETEPEAIDEVIRQSPTTEELKKVRDRVDEAITRREAKETISEETAVTEEPEPEQEPEPEPEPKTPRAKDETPISPQQLTQLDAMMKKTGVDLSALGKYMNKDKGWKVQKLGELKCWQFEEIMAAFKMGQEQPGAGKLL